ncbi:MerR family transcriptional regulator [Solwaraspora sp. WMMA2080]|uniref:MerR family transcriptional regulator n=1 Tax=unclassified Solwaraspora TaxID=2627926 RepID=UPI00248BEF24|nr:MULTISPECIES: MerR family transcriptional regulator [unclassified Solwaraspora]WBB96766.1 MerR family transcriptional regulator [Solwaraspora sp. WMMA2059]WBC19330.1 MerR family transcriptional regulator [Solwaraspora sp. WMMA2080]
MSDDALSAGSVARRLGVAVTTLRTWHQRYGLGPTRHVKGHHRRYSREDLARLEVMRRLTAEGVSPAEAARWARGNAAPPAPAGLGPGPGQGRAGGGHTIAVGTAGPAARGLARAAVRLDDLAMREIIERGLRADGVIATWDRVVRPVLAGVGDRYAATAGFIEVEHLLSRCVSAAFAAVTGPASVTGPVPAALPGDSSGPLVGAGSGVLLACTDDEQHTLPLEALAAALVEAGVVARLLGARVPVTALVAAVDRTGPAAVVLWSHTPATADLGQLAAARSGRHRPVLVLAVGPGWPVPELPDGVRHCADLTDAFTLCRSADRSVGRQHLP